MEKIEKFEELIKDYIGPNKTIIDTKIENLTAPGENYVSQIVKVDVTLKNNDDIENLYVVAKLIRKGEQMGPTAEVTKNEIVFYTEVLPAIRSFYEKYGFPYPEFYPEYVGGRINLTGTDEADDDAVIVLKNLKIEGYENVDRHIGFDLATAKLVLTDLAAFHAIPLAMKLLEPDVFETEIKNKCLEMKFQMKQNVQKGNNGNVSSNEKSDIPDSKEKPALMSPPVIFRLILQLFEQDDKYLEVSVRYKKFLELVEKLMKGPANELLNKKPVEPFATMMHCDMWINNTMQVMRDGVPIKNKLVDFQMCKIGTPAHDLVFLLISSVELSCLKEHLDTLLEHYYQKFTDVLKKCGCYGEQFSYENFLDELKTGSERGIMQSLFMIPMAIYGKKGQAVNPSEMSRTMTLESIPAMAKEKLIFLCEEATKRGWI